MRHPPIRIATRLLAEMQTGIASAGLRAMDGNLDRFMIFTLIVRQSLSGRDGTPAPISTYSIANSLSRPYETVRRHANTLIEMGLCVRHAQGLLPVQDELRTPTFVELITVSHDWFVRLIDDLRRTGVLLPKERASGSYQPKAGLEAVVDLTFAVVDTNRQVHQDWAELVIFSTLLCANVQHFAHDPAIAPRYRDPAVATPDGLHRPVRLSKVARALGMSESTVRRRVADMVGQGAVVKSDGGLLVSEAWLNRPATVETSVATYRNLKRVLERLAAAGFPFGKPESAYMRGRPDDPLFD